jgi:hypothetical protein
VLLERVTDQPRPRSEQAQRNNKRENASFAT